MEPIREEAKKRENGIRSQIDNIIVGQEGKQANEQAESPKDLIDMQPSRKWARHSKNHRANQSVD